MALILWAAAWAQDYRFPTSAEDYGEYYPTAYVDHGGVTDWNCGNLSYSGHNGSDWGGGSWSGMDAGRDIVAAALGTVLATNDGEADDCSTGDCDGGSGFGNYVKLQHADGKVTYYAHMKTWSVAVAVGDTVTCGQKMGEMGSSGHSTGPHLHFEVRTSSGSSTDPFEGGCAEPPSYWVDQGTYGELPALVCDDVPACTVADRLRCGATIASSNGAAGATATHSAYGCDEFVYSGAEIAYEFSTELGEAVTLSLGGLGADLDLFVLTSEACDGTNAVGCSTNPNGDAESVSFTATAGQRYVVVVDGYEGASSSFSLTASCAGGWPGENEPTDTAVDTAPPVEEDTSSVGPPEDEARVAPPGTMVALEGDAAGCAATPGLPGIAAIALALLAPRRRRA